MSFDICPSCDGTGERNSFSGERCLHCNGTGMIEDRDPDDEDYPEDDPLDYVARCGARFDSNAEEAIEHHHKTCRACRYDHDCDRADLLRKEMKEDGGYIE